MSVVESYPDKEGSWNTHIDDPRFRYFRMVWVWLMQDTTPDPRPVWMEILMIVGLFYMMFSLLFTFGLRFP